ncbi:hypothetical protein [Diplocloster modestus]|uniref:Uncharacterized protein n=1 Tax=Diplocloster modestus TaxID=2850322 RepID=A0ABS6KD71_9FIRM|nr:hypothetical protein [Diplocloster modestus]MBU9728464.1 hypothetical protein [Diplocloster modestus]
MGHGEKLLPPLTKRFRNESDNKTFRFTFYCDYCGTGYQAPTTPFSGAGEVRDDAELPPLQRLLWQTEYEDAYERANRQALYHFTRCAECGKVVCEDCLDEFEDIPLCPDCRAKQGRGDDKE